MSLSSSFATIFAQATSAAAAAGSGAASTDTSAAQGPQQPFGITVLYFVIILGAFYFVLFRPQQQAKKQQEEKIKAARTGDKIITSGGIHGLITNVKDNTVIVKIADNVKIEIEKSHIDKIVRAESDETSEKPAPAKK